MHPTSEHLAYHAARILMLIRQTGKPQGSRDRLPGIRGRTLLAKLDFFVRYPTYLLNAGAILNIALTPQALGLETTEEAEQVEARMVRYMYGPWDHTYYLALAYLIGKQLISVEVESRTEVFRLTPLGLSTATNLLAAEDNLDIAKRTKAAYTLFNRFNGSSLKAFIYEHFPEVVGRKMGARI
jgi:hypothetical protein